MSTIPSIGVPELAGIGSYQSAARIGYSVDETVRRLLRFQWLERRIMAVMVAKLIATPEWEVKCALALHQWQCAEHVEGLRQRVAEMRHPIPLLDQTPDPELERFCEELFGGPDTLALVVAVYQVALPALIAEYRAYLGTANVLVDYPSRRTIGFALADLEAAVAWGATTRAGLDARATGAAQRRATEWGRHLGDLLAAVGGVSGRDPTHNPVPVSQIEAPVVPDTTPARDARFAGQYNFEFPPHAVSADSSAPADERNLALLCKRTLEMDVPEMMASVMIERTDLPWEFHRDYARQLWDEMRHAMMGSVALTARGIDWSQIPLNVGFGLRLNRHATALERQIVLFAIEQSLMPGETGKRYEYRTAQESGDQLSEHFHDFDWADEVLHAQIGRRWLKHEGISVDQAVDQAHTIHQRTWAALEQYRDREPQVDWWDGFVRRVLGRPSAVAPERRADLKILAE